MKNDGPSKFSNGSSEPPRTNGNGKVPYGRDAVKKAILDATEKLLLTKRPSKITVREIAEAANIKHPLVHRHFGTKEKVIAATHARGIARIERKIAELENLEGSIGEIFTVVKKAKFRLLAISQAMIDGVDPRTIPTSIPAVKQLLELVKKRCREPNRTTDFAPELITAVLTATVLGWYLYEPYLLTGTRQENKNPDEIQKEVVDFLEVMLRKI
ncbi:MAG TPA: TetR/AcrR family transcriptional regulator [Pyrinomonadaceae bacterium]|jgi:AcrR family transcriptional regulator